MIVIHTQSKVAPFPEHKVRPPAKYIGNYVIDYENPLGKGNFSTVYRSSKVSVPGSVFAVKLINTMNLREQKIEHLVGAQIEILKATNHINVITCHDVFSDDTWCYIFTPFYDGGNLESKIKKALPTEVEILPMIKDIFEGLHYLEKNKIIHRDIKAANIFIKNGRATVADLGFAKYFKYFCFYFSQPFYDLTIGSPPFMPPEALTKGFYCNKTDVWAFGALLFEIFHGESPFAKCTELNELIQQVSTSITVVNIRLDLSIEMKQMILSCLEVDLKKRPTFSEIQQSWYFQKLFYPTPMKAYSSPVASKIISRSPLKILTPNQNQDSLNKTKLDHTPIKSPTFAKIKQLKSEFKRKISQQSSISSQIIIEMERTPKKSLLVPFEKNYFSHKKSNTEFLDNEEDLNYSNQFSKTGSKIIIDESTKTTFKIWKYLNQVKTFRIHNQLLFSAKQRVLRSCLSKLLYLEDKIKTNQVAPQKESHSLSHLSYEVFRCKNQVERQIQVMEASIFSHQQTDYLSSKSTEKSQFNENLIHEDLDFIAKYELQQMKCSPQNEENQNKIKSFLSEIKKENGLLLNQSNSSLDLMSNIGINSPKTIKINGKELDKSKRLSIQENLFSPKELGKNLNLDHRFFKNYSMSLLRQ